METGKASVHHPQFYACLTYELIGTAIITMSFSMTGRDNFLRAVCFMFLYLWAVRVSGGHFNPATTLAVYLKNKDKKNENGRYAFVVMIIQVIGAFMGVLFSFLVLKDYPVLSSAKFMPEISHQPHKFSLTQINPGYLGNLSVIANLTLYPSPYIN